MASSTQHRFETASAPGKALLQATAISGLLLMSGCSYFSNHASHQAPKMADAETLYNYGIDALHSGHYEVAGVNSSFYSRIIPIPATPATQN